MKEGGLIKRRKRKKPRNPEYGRTAKTKKYNPIGDNTSIDNFIIGLLDFLEDKEIDIYVSGLSSVPRRWRYQKPWISVCNDYKEDSLNVWRKAYKIGVLIEPSKWCLNELTERIRKYESANQDYDYYEEFLKPISEKIHNKLYPYVQKFDQNFNVSAGIKSDGKVSAWLTVFLIITTYDAVVHCGKYLSDYPKKFLDELSEILDFRFRNNPEKMIELYKDLDYQFKIMRIIDRKLRKLHGVSQIGEGYVNERILFRYLKKYFCNAKREYSPAWLGKQRFDIYIPSLKVAIEYHGVQHYEPIDIFGGVDGFIDRQNRDKRKKALCEANKVFLLIWPYTKQVNNSEVESLVKEIERNRIRSKLK